MALTLKSVNPAASNAGTEASIAGANLFNKALDRIKGGVKGALDSNIAVKKDDSAIALNRAIANFDSSTEDTIGGFKAQAADLIKAGNLTTEDQKTLLTASNNADDALFTRGQQAFDQSQQAGKNIVTDLTNKGAVADAQQLQVAEDFQSRIAGATSKELPGIIAEVEAAGLEGNTTAKLQNAATQRRAANQDTSLKDLSVTERFEDRADVVATRSIANDPGLQADPLDDGLNVLFKIEDIRNAVNENKNIQGKDKSIKSLLDQLGYTPEIIFSALEADLREGGIEPTRGNILQRAQERGIPLTSADVIGKSTERDKVTGQDVVKARAEEARQVRLGDAKATKDFNTKIRRDAGFRKSQIDALIPENSNLFNPDDRDAAIRAVSALIQNPAIAQEDMPADELIGLVAEFGKTGRFFGGQFNPDEFLEVAKAQANVNKLRRTLSSAKTETGAKSASDKLQKAIQNLNTATSGKSSFNPQISQ